MTNHKFAIVIFVRALQGLVTHALQWSHRAKRAES